MLTQYKFVTCFVDVFFMIVKCDEVKNCMLLEIHKCCKWLDCNMGKYPMDYTYSLQIKIEQPDYRQGNGMKSSDTEMCMWK